MFGPTTQCGFCSTPGMAWATVCKQHGGRGTTCCHEKAHAEPEYMADAIARNGGNFPGFIGITKAYKETCPACIATCQGLANALRDISLEVPSQLFKPYPQPDKSAFPKLVDATCGF